MNADAGAVWVCYYTDFPLIRVGPKGDVDVWRANLAGSHAFAVSGDKVVFHGGVGRWPDSAP